MKQLTTLSKNAHQKMQLLTSEVRPIGQMFKNSMTQRNFSQNQQNESQNNEPKQTFIPSKKTLLSQTFFGLGQGAFQKPSQTMEEQSKLSNMNQANRDIQSFVDSQQNRIKSGMIPMMIFTEEMSRANFILDRWLRGKTEEKPKQEEDLSAKDKQGVKEEGEESDWDFDEWNGTRKEGLKNGESENEDDDGWNNDDDDDQDGGVMMPVPDASF